MHYRFSNRSILGPAVKLQSYACSSDLGLDLLFSISGVDTTTGTAVMVREFGAGLVHATLLNQMIRFRMILLAAYYNSLCRINMSHHLWVVESQFCSLFSDSFASATSLPPWQ
jgi:hypothetical protein